jgi:hypothetical protein
MGSPNNTCTCIIYDMLEGMEKRQQVECVPDVDGILEDGVEAR